MTRFASPVRFVAIATILLAGACGGAEPASGPADGGLIAFSSFRDGVHGIYVVGVDGGRVRRLVSNTAVDAAWSPDGRQIAYFAERSRDDRECPQCVDLYVMEADGSRKRRLTRSSGGYGGAAWAPDGNLIAFSRCDGGVDADEDACAVYVIAPDGSGLRRVTPYGLYGEPVWSPDGERMALDDVEEDGIYVIAADGSGVRRLTSSRDTDSAWSPDGSEIAFTRMTLLGGRDARHDIYVIAVDGTGLSRLTDDGLKAAFDPSWSPDGEVIAFVGRRELPGLCSDGAAIYVMAPDGSSERPMTPGRPMYGDPTWSPDGKQIAFESLSYDDCMSDELGEWPIYVSEADGSAERRLGPDAHTDFGLAWQPALTPR